MDVNPLFIDATKRICGHLNIEDALYSSFVLLKKHMPVDKLLLQYYEEKQSAMRTVAVTSETQGHSINVITPLSLEGHRHWNGYEKESFRDSSCDTFLIDNPNNMTVYHEMLQSHDINTTSLLILPLNMDDTLVRRELWVVSEKEQGFSQHHAEVLDLLKIPFEIAMSNASKYHNKLKLFNREFFWDITTKTCGNMEDGLKYCYDYLSSHIPCDTVYLERHSRDYDSMQIIARADKEKGEKMDALIPFSKESKEKMAEMTNIWKAGKLPPVLVINNPEEEPVTRHLLEMLGEPLSSAMSLPLVMDDTVLGALVVLAKGNDRYTVDDARLFTDLKIPFFIAMANALKHREIIELKDMLADDNRYLRSELNRLSGDTVIGAHFGLKDVMFKVRQVASLNSPVLLLGDTGVGKDVIANTIHYTSARSDGPFISVNCGAIPDSLIDSELFGHEKGAFTGALTQRRGRFERADKGTIFLDEIGELPPMAQVRLLKVLQHKVIERVGGNKEIPLDIRIIAATNRNLEEMVQNGEFREDLWFRLNVFPILIPPLCDRKSDIPELLQYFIKIKSKEMKLPDIPTIAEGQMEYLMNYHWPGNVRELQNVVERALILKPSGPLMFDHLNPGEFQESEGDSGYPFIESDSLDQAMSFHIRNVLSKSGGKINGPGGAAERLEVNPNTLRNRMRKLGIDFGRQAAAD